MTPVPCTDPSAVRAVPSISTASTRSVPITRTGLVQKCRKIRRSADPCSRAAKSRRTATLRAATLSLPTTASLDGSRSRSRGSTITSTPGSWPSSRSSLVVKAVYAGPRRPSTCTSVTCLVASAASTSSAMSVSVSSSAFLMSTRVTSRATLPTPTTTADVDRATSSESWRCCSRGLASAESLSRARSRSVSGCTSGWPQYQATKSGAATLPGSSSPGMPSRLSVPAPKA